MGETETLAVITSQLETIARKLGEIEAILNGQGGKLGMVAKVEIVWRSWVWIVCTVSAACGAAATYTVTRLLP